MLPSLTQLNPLQLAHSPDTQIIQQLDKQTMSLVCTLRYVYTYPTKPTVYQDIYCSSPIYCETSYHTLIKLLTVQLFAMRLSKYCFNNKINV